MTAGMSLLAAQLLLQSIARIRALTPALSRRERA
jgi:hypothetical protein